MSSIALGVWVAFLKQPALPGEAPQTKKKSDKSKVVQKYTFLFFWGALGQAVHQAVLKKQTKPPKLNIPKK
jgi:hypothetical protein